jgi:hypothetical protein
MPYKVLSPDVVPEQVLVTLAHFDMTGSKKAETSKVSSISVPQGLDPRRDWLVSLETADSHGLLDLVALLPG